MLRNIQNKLLQKEVNKMVIGELISIKKNSKLMTVVEH